MIYSKQLELPGLVLEFHVKHAVQENNNLLIAGGRAPQKNWLREAAADKKIYCADRGAVCVLSAGLKPAYLLGDCDSAAAEIYELARAAGAQIKIFPSAKDDTDLQLLLQHLPEGNLIASGIWGGRFDHLYSNIFTLLSFKKQCKNIVIMADEQECLLFLETDEAVKITFAEPQKNLALSLLPLSSKCRTSFTGVQWAIHEEKLQQLHPYSISNVLRSDSNVCQCSCLSGSVGLYVAWKNENKFIMEGL